MSILYVKKYSNLYFLTYSLKSGHGGNGLAQKMVE